MKKLALFAVVGMLLAATPGQAGKLYFGAQVGKSSLGVPAGGGVADLDDGGYKIYGGYKFGRFLSAEMGYADLGSFSGATAGVTVEAESDLISAMLVGTFPVTRRFELSVKAGAVDWSATIALTDMMGSVTFDDSGADFTYGGGVSYRIGERIAIRGEWETYDFDGFGDAEFASIGVRFGY